MLTNALLDTHHGVTRYDRATGRGVSVRFLREGQTYSAKADPIAKLMLGLMGSVAESERSIIKERQAEGIARAKARGVYKGRAKVLTNAQVVQARGWAGDGVPKRRWPAGSVSGGPPCINTSWEALRKRSLS